MTVTLTPEEKRVAAKLIEKIKEEDRKELEPDSAARFADKVSELAAKGLTDKQIAEELSDRPRARSLQGRLAIARMERCM